MDLIKYVQDKYVESKDFPVFKAGDTVTVYYKIREGEKTRTQFFRGDVLIFESFEEALFIDLSHGFGNLVLYFAVLRSARASVKNIAGVLASFIGVAPPTFHGLKAPPSSV